jgi:hypothetical protein
VWPCWSAAGDSDARVSGRSGTSERGLSSGRVRCGRARRGEAAATTEEERRGGDLGETEMKWLRLD